MSKFTKPERQKLKQLVADSMLNHFTVEETIDYIDRQLHVKISSNYVAKIRKWIRDDMQEEFEHLRRDKGAYINVFLERINELRDLRREVRVLMKKTEDGNLKVKCASELESLTLSLTNMYDLIPAIAARFSYPIEEFKELSDRVGGLKLEDTREEAAEEESQRQELDDQAKFTSYDTDRYFPSKIRKEKNDDTHVF